VSIDHFLKVLNMEFLVGRPEGRRPLGRPRRIILNWIFKKWDGMAWPGLIWIRIGTGGGLL
jgi:hypothetical protein